MSGPRFQPILSAGPFSSQLVGDSRPSSPASRSPASPHTAAPEARETVDPAEAEAARLSAAVSAAEARLRASLSAEVSAAQAEAAEATALARAMAEALDAERTAQAAEARRLVGGMVLETVRRLIGEQPFLRDKMLKNMLEDAAGHLLGEREVVLRVRADQVALARGLVADRVGWTVREDVAITAGLRVEAARGTLDATLGVALENISEAIEDWLETTR